MIRISVLVFAAALSASSAYAAGPMAGALTDSISYETGHCFGPCAVYTVTVHSDGKGRFEGHRFTKVKGARTFRITRAQFRAFAAWLEPLRPPSGSVHYDGPPRCDEMATDQGSADVKWRKADGREQELYFYYGCDLVGKRAMAERLGKAPELLPIAAFIRARH